MGALIAALRKDGGDSLPVAQRMLKKLIHRGKDSFGIANGEEIFTSDKLELLENRFSGPVVIAHGLSRTLLKDRPQPIKGDAAPIVFEGRLFLEPEVSDAEAALKIIGDDLEKGSAELIRFQRGAYVFALALPDSIIVGRDPVGAKPLYYGEDGVLCAVASERKALASFGVRDVKPFPPGHIAVIDSSGFRFDLVKRIFQPEICSVGIEEGAEAVGKLLYESVKWQTADLDGVGVAFSGGVDSAVIAKIASDISSGVHLFTVGLEGRSELEHAEEVADELGLPIFIKRYGEEDVVNIMGDVVWSMEKPDPVDVAIAIPIMWVSEAARKRGYRTLLFGQGCDEIFGGYHRYLRIYRESGRDAVLREMYEDVAGMHLGNFDRDEKICSAIGVEPRYPYADYELIEYALSLPLNLKIRSMNDPLRKAVLRRLSSQLGVPSVATEARKRAVQYSTGVNSVLRKVAKREGKSLRTLLYELYERRLLREQVLSG